MEQNHLAMSLKNFYAKSTLPAFITYGDFHLGNVLADKVNELFEVRIANLDSLNVCEIGCGGGLVADGFLCRLEEKYKSLYEKAKMTLVDVSGKNLKNSRERLRRHNHDNKVDFVCSDALHLPLKSKSVDFQYSNELLDCIPFELFEKIDGKWYRIEYEMNGKSTKRQKRVDTSNDTFFCPIRERDIEPCKRESVDLDIDAQDNQSVLIPVGLKSFFSELNRVLKSRAYALHIDYFSPNIFHHKLRLFIPDPEERVRIDLQSDKGGVHSVSVPEGYRDMFDVTYDVPLDLTLKEAKKVGLKPVVYKNQGEIFRNTEAGNEPVVFAGDLQKFMNMFSLIQPLEQYVGREVYSTEKIKELTKDYTFFIPLKKIKDRVNNYLYEVLETSVLPYWIGISLKKMPDSEEEKETVVSGHIPKELRLDYKTILFRK